MTTLLTFSFLVGIKFSSLTGYHNLVFVSPYLSFSTSFLSSFGLLEYALMFLFISSTLEEKFRFFFRIYSMHPYYSLLRILYHLI